MVKTLRRRQVAYGRVCSRRGASLLGSNGTERSRAKPSHGPVSSKRSREGLLVLAAERARIKNTKYALRRGAFREMTGIESCLWGRACSPARLLACLSVYDRNTEDGGHIRPHLLPPPPPFFSWSVLLPPNVYSSWRIGDRCCSRGLFAINTLLIGFAEPRVSWPRARDIVHFTSSDIKAYPHRAMLLTITSTEITLESSVRLMATCRSFACPSHPKRWQMTGSKTFRML